MPPPAHALRTLFIGPVRRLMRARLSAKAWLPIGAVAVLAVCAQAAGLAPWLRYERSAVAAGELWRLITASLVHLGWLHLAMNLVGALLLRLLFAEVLPARVLLLALTACALAVGIGLHLGSRDVEWYVGMSGALHGLFVVGAALMLRSDKERGFAWLLLAGLVLKIGWEQSGGVSPSSDWIGGAIVVDAHLYGAAGGLLTVAALGAGRRLVQKRKGPPGGGP